MTVGVCTLTLWLPECQSLKDKRRVLQRLIDRVRNRFNVAVAEVGGQNTWQTAVLGIACVSNSRRHADEILARLADFVRECGELEVTGCEVELL